MIGYEIWLSATIVPTHPTFTCSKSILQIPVPVLQIPEQRVKSVQT